jgi:DNA-binding LytR/AlgR family response regulator
MKALIVEDEKLAQQTLQRALERNFPDIEVVAITESVKGTLAWLRTPGNTADLIFMDVELSDGDCFEIFRKVDVKANVVMTTAYDNYAVKAFEAGSIDYLMKPIDAAPLRRAVERCRRSVRTIDAGRLLDELVKRKESSAYKERFLVHFNDRIVPVKGDDIAFFYSEDKNNHVVTRDGAVYIIDGSLDLITEGLDPERFFRISRSCVFAKDEVRSVTKLPGGRLRITPATTVPRTFGNAPDMVVSRSRAEEFLTWLEN